MKQSISVRMSGQGSVAPPGLWLCRTCRREFKLPKVPGTCETVYSICMTCFAISCVEEIDEDETENR